MQDRQRTIADRQRRRVGVGGVVEPGLTTVRFYQKQVGVEAARMLLQMLEHPENGGPVRQTTLGYSVVDRGSIRIKEDA